MEEQDRVYGGGGAVGGGAESVRTSSSSHALPHPTLQEEKSGAGFRGRKPGGGTTNREKSRLKNFGMLRKSSNVQVGGLLMCGDLRSAVS
jgi:hypothetical protein